MSLTYLTTNELAGVIKYDSRTIREQLKDSVLIEGTHYIRPFGGRKILYIWEHIERDMSVGLARLHTICTPNAANVRAIAAAMAAASQTAQRCCSHSPIPAKI